MVCVIEGGQWKRKGGGGEGGGRRVDTLLMYFRTHKEGGGTVLPDTDRKLCDGGRGAGGGAWWGLWRDGDRGLGLKECWWRTFCGDQGGGGGGGPVAAEYQSVLWLSGWQAGVEQSVSGKRI